MFQRMCTCVTINMSSFMPPAGGSGGRAAAASAAACDYTVEGKKKKDERDEMSGVAPRCATATRGHTPPGQGVKYKLTA